MTAPPKQTGLMFKPELSMLIATGRKTQTRRAFDQYTMRTVRQAISEGRISDFLRTGTISRDDARKVLRLCPLGGAGDWIYVRETWQHANAPDGPYIPGTPVFYAADYIGTAGGMRGDGRTWIPSIHMPKEAARLWLRIERVRIQRLHDISTADIKKEGVRIPRSTGPVQEQLFGTDPLQRKQIKEREAMQAWRDLWESTGGNWQENPWLWVIDFRAQLDMVCAENTPLTAP